MYNMFIILLILDPIGAKCWNVWGNSWNGTHDFWKGLKKWLIFYPQDAVHWGPGKESSSHLN